MSRGDDDCCSHCPPIEPTPPFDELSHEIENNILSVKVAKTAGRIKTVRGLDDGSGSDSSVVANCEDASGNQCRVGCAKVNVIPNTPAPPKKPSEEMVVLRSTRKILNSDDMRNTLEIELRTPRNYDPLPEPPPPPVIESAEDVAAQLAATEMEQKNEKNGKNKKKKLKVD